VALPSPCLAVQLENCVTSSRTSAAVANASAVVVYASAASPIAI